MIEEIQHSSCYTQEPVSYFAHISSNGEPIVFFFFLHLLLLISLPLYSKTGLSFTNPPASKTYIDFSVDG